MKHINKKIISPVFLFIISALLLSSCGSEHELSHWEGEWHRRVEVPKGIQGRCIDETLSIHKKQWSLIAVIHSSYDCNQPFLELGYKGLLEEVAIKKNSDNRQLRLTVNHVHLNSMADLGASGKRALSESAVATLSSKYVKVQDQVFMQQVELSEDHQTMQSNVYQSLLDVAVPLYPADAIPAAYIRAK